MDSAHQTPRETVGSIMRNNMSFAQLVTQFRQQRGLSQGQLATAARLSRIYIYHLEAGMRQNPSARVVQSITRALALQENERHQLYTAFIRLTGQTIDDEPLEQSRLDVGHLAHLLVLSISYPAHSLDRLWYLHTWNQAAITLFEVQQEIDQGERMHMLELVFGKHRHQFLDWENLAQRLVSDFQYTTRSLKHLPEYKELWKRLRNQPEFRRIAQASTPERTPAPSFIFHMKHSQLGHLVLRTAPTVFTHINSYSMVSYVPSDQHTMEIYTKCRWQPIDPISGNHLQVF
jgi:transcriptional regulator with XRE-family HTH domain